MTLNMHPAIVTMLERYKCATASDYENALKEIMQEVALLGLWRSKFFEHAAFYGGSALRILHGLDRFSEDLDFSLLSPREDFKLNPYLDAVKAELDSMGFDVLIEKRYKSVETAIESDIVLVGIGISPSVGLARDAGLAIGNGIIVNNRLSTSQPDIYAAGDNAFFPYLALGKLTRIEHWDNALNQGRQAGRNMAGADEIYHYMPYFFSDLFEFGYEAVGEIDPTLDIEAKWEVEFNKGMIFFRKNEIIRGVMMCNVWNKVDWARELIRNHSRMDTVFIQPQLNNKNQLQETL